MLDAVLPHSAHSAYHQITLQRELWDPLTFSIPTCPDRFWCHSSSKAAVGAVVLQPDQNEAENPISAATVELRTDPDTIEPSPIADCGRIVLHNNRALSAVVSYQRAQLFVLADI
jgi:hypothetical protein